GFIASLWRSERGGRRVPPACDAPVTAAARYENTGGCTHGIHWWKRTVRGHGEPGRATQRACGAGGRIHQVQRREGLRAEEPADGFSRKLLGQAAPRSGIGLNDLLGAHPVNPESAG